MYALRYQDHEDRFLNRVISGVSVVLMRETSLAIAEWTGEFVAMTSEIVRVVSLSTTEISEKALF